MRWHDKTKWIVPAVAVLLVVLLGIWLVRSSGSLGDFAKEQQDQWNTPELVDENKDYTLKQVDFMVVRKLNENAFLIVEDDLVGMIDSQGEYLVKPLFTYMNYFDGEWISFEDEYNMGYVYDMQGNQLFTFDGLVEKTSEEGIKYNIWTSYQKGIKTEMIIGTENSEYFGVRYYNAETNDLIFEAVGGYQQVSASTLPDETGTAVVIQNGGVDTTIHRITKDGCATEVLEDSDSVFRDIYYSGYISWVRNTMSEGWLKAAVWEREKVRRDSEGVTKEAFYNIHTGEVILLPDAYQNTYAAYYENSKGLYYGISTLTESEYYGVYPEVMYYAICHGNRMLSEEIYTWMEFGERYILAGNETLAHVLDYEGNVLKEFADMAEAFVDGKLVVYSGVGVYLMDEELNVDKDAVMSKSYFCGPGFVWNGNNGYMVIQKTGQDK